MRTETAASLPLPGCIAAAMAVLAIAVPCSRADDSPWSITNALFRITFAVPDDPCDSVLVRVPEWAGATCSTPFAAQDRERRWLPAAVVHEDDDDLWVVVALGERPKPRRRPDYRSYYRRDADSPGRPPGVRPPTDTSSRIHLYAGSPALPPAPGNAPATNPVLVRAYSTAGRSDPNTWEKLRYLLDNGRREIGLFAQSDISGMALPDTAARDRSSAIIQAHCRVRCPVSGMYRFALAGSNPAFLFIGDRPAAECTDRYADGTAWHAGEALFLQAGFHDLTLFVYGGLETDTRVGWSRPTPGGTDSLPEPPSMERILPEYLLTGLEAEWTQMDLPDVDPIPEIRAHPEIPFSFRGSDAVFTPVSFSLAVFEPGRRQYGTARVSFGDTGKPRFPDMSSPLPALDHTYASRGLFQVHLDFLEPEPGRALRSSTYLDLRWCQPVEHAASFALSSLPAACYTRDVLEPVLLVSGSGPQDVNLRLVLDITARRGGITRIEKDLALTAYSRQIPLFRERAGDVASFTWKVSVGDTVIGAGSTDVLTPPFSIAPLSASGDKLLSRDGRQMVMAAEEIPGAPPRRQAGRAFPARLIIHDDTLATAEEADKRLIPALGAALESRGRDRATLLHAAIPPGTSAPDQAGRILRFTAIPKGLSSYDAVVVSLGLRDAEAAVPAPLFERMTAVLCDLLADAHGVRVVLATPPPFTFNPGLARDYAEAVHRVAATRGIPVADLYTAFNTALEKPEDGFVPDGTRLSPAGMDLSAAMLARSLTQTASPKAQSTAR